MTKQELHYDPNQKHIICFSLISSFLTWSWSPTIIHALNYFRQLLVHLWWEYWIAATYPWSLQLLLTDWHKFSLIVKNKIFLKIHLLWAVFYPFLIDFDHLQLMIDSIHIVLHPGYVSSTNSTKISYMTKTKASMASYHIDITMITF